MSTEAELIERLRKIEALHARPGTPGERAAAADAMARIRDRIEEAQRADPAVEIQFSLPDEWSRSLFIALLRREDIKPYRYRGQRRTTVMARMPRRFADDVLWPEYCDLNDTLRTYLDDVTQRVVAAAISSDTTPIEERREIGRT